MSLVISNFDWLDYFSLSDDFKLFWKWRGDVRPQWNGNYAGKEAGTKNIGYIQIILNKKPFLAHRIIWEIYNGKIPKGMEIDHINHIRDDNRIENLRLVSKQDNLKNQSKRNDNTSGVTGVSWNKREQKFRAYININGKEKHIGYFVDLKSAVLARKSLEKEIGYHENHGAENER
ncbi:HNH homing endonuclease [Shigella phage Sf12]|uniref:HNH homing endonuclease n=1 Tax=Shigella phage Sf12 TaxID=2024315 RepID=A0A291AXK3_9CAUD|nr:HNH endonuclease [Shigella phage Sf12]ATE85749.1 HNH homing endonuclease [Shigella phage Sf12]